MNDISTKLRRASLYIFYGLLAYMPLHIFVSTVIGANLGGLAFLKAAKDVVLMFGFCLVFFGSVKQSWFAAWVRQKLVLAIFAYALLTLVLALVRPTDQDAEILGVTYNLRFLVFFLYAWLLTKTFPKEPLRQTAFWLVMSSATLVVFFGIIQYVLLPDSALTRLGFTRENGVLPAFFIDDKPDLERVMSTLRDPNSLGSYLIIIVGLCAAAWRAAPKKARQAWAGLTLASLLCLLLTFSRSALLGLLLAAGVFVVLSRMRGAERKASVNTRRIRIAGLIVAILAVIGVGGLYAARDSYVVQNVIFHADQSTTLEDPNELRLKFWRQSAEAIVDEPLGSGPGTAGLASIKNNVQGTELNENYYLQIASEVGVLGLLLFLVILLAVARRLYVASPGNVYVQALLAAFVGLAVTNLLVHIWANEAVAYTWWGLAGLWTVRLTSKSKL